MQLPACLVESIKHCKWTSLSDSPRIQEVFRQIPIRPVLHSVSGMIGMTKWWREDLDDETLHCYFGTLEDSASPSHMSRMKTVMIGSLGPDLLIALDYRNSSVDPSVVFLGEEGSWRKITENVSDLLLALDQ